MKEINVCPNCGVQPKLQDFSWTNLIKASQFTCRNCWYQGLPILINPKVRKKIRFSKKTMHFKNESLDKETILAYVILFLIILAIILQNLYLIVVGFIILIVLFTKKIVSSFS